MLPSRPAFEDAKAVRRGQGVVGRQLSMFELTVASRWRDAAVTSPKSHQVCNTVSHCQGPTPLILSLIAITYSIANS